MERHITLNYLTNLRDQLTTNPIPTTLVLISTLTITYLIWTLTYNLTLHPLSPIPGPLLARTSTLWTCYHDFFLRGKLPFALISAHQKYGPILRITPNEVHISDPKFLDTIFALRNRNAPELGGVIADGSLAGAEDFQLHRLRREALNPYFSVKNVMGLEEMLREKASLLKGVVERVAGKGEVLNLSDAFFAYANDVVRTFTFGASNGLLSDLELAKKQREDLKNLLLGVPMGIHFPWIPRLLGFLLGRKGMPAAVHDLENFRDAVGKDIDAIFSDDKSKPDQSVFYDLRDSTTLPPKEKRKERLKDEATLIVMAGTGSAARSLEIALFYLLHQPDLLGKLRKELSTAQQESAGDEIPLSTLLTLPYLSAVIQESHRVSFGVTRRLPRYSPNEVLTYTASSGPHKGTTYTFPPKTWLSSSTSCIHTDESLFPDPWAFEPERWIPADSRSEQKSNTSASANRNIEAVNRRKRFMLSLGKGHRKCIGINLASAEMCLALAKLVNFDMKLVETDESDVWFERDFQISHPRDGSRGVRVLVDRKA